MSHSAHGMSLLKSSKWIKSCDIDDCDQPVKKLCKMLNQNQFLLKLPINIMTHAGGALSFEISGGTYKYYRLVIGLYIKCDETLDMFIWSYSRKEGEHRESRTESINPNNFDLIQRKIIGYLDEDEKVEYCLN